jgi:hypothetical protein
MAGVSVDEARELICEMCRTFYQQGWVSGTGGGISVKAEGDLIVMAPSGVQKERMRPSDMFVLDAAGAVVAEPEARPPPYKPPKLSECSPLFMAVRDRLYLVCCESRFIFGGRGRRVFRSTTPQHQQHARKNKKTRRTSCAAPAPCCTATRSAPCLRRCSTPGRPSSG